MPPDTLFTFCNVAVLPAWLLLVAAPRWKWSATLVSALIVPGLLALLYVALITSQIGHLEGGFTSLAQVGKLFENRYALLAGWVHYLTFDLFAGSWQVRDAQRLGISHWLVIPCLLLTLLFGPAGLLLYFLLRGVVKRKLVIER